VDQGGGHAFQSRSDGLPEGFQAVDQRGGQVPAFRTTQELRCETLVCLVQPVPAGSLDAMQC
jgi:hypothetical protein